MSAPSAMRCVEVGEAVTDWMEGALDAADRLLLEQHLATCPSCVAYVAQLRLVPALLQRRPRDRAPKAARTALLDAFHHGH